MKALFLSYTGLLEPLGQSQVLPYVVGLAARGHEMSVVSFERDPPQGEIDSLAQSLGRAGVRWVRLSYHKWPPVLSTAYDVLNAVRAVERLRRRFGVQLVHARSHVPCLAAEVVRLRTGLPYLFDHRGLMGEEYVEAGLWRRHGVLHRLTHRLEARFVAQARAVVVLSHRLQAELGPVRASRVVPCAVDLSRFRPAKPPASDYDLVYAGSWTGLYESETVLAFHHAYRTLRPQARLLLLVPKQRGALASGEGVEVLHPPSRDVPGLLRRARAGVSFRRGGRAAIAASPVKVSEYLASGLPVVTNRGVGDLDELLASSAAGVLVNGTDPKSLLAAAADLDRLLSDAETPARCRQVAEAHFDLEGAVTSYDQVYRALERVTLSPDAQAIHEPS